MAEASGRASGGVPGPTPRESASAAARPQEKSCGPPVSPQLQARGVKWPSPARQADAAAATTETSLALTSHVSITHSRSLLEGHV